MDTVHSDFVKDVMLYNTLLFKSIIWDNSLELALLRVQTLYTVTQIPANAIKIFFTPTSEMGLLIPLPLLLLLLLVQ